MKKGFTLIEFLIVVAIIGLLSSVILTSVRNARCKQEPNRKGCEEVRKEKEKTAEKTKEFTDEDSYGDDSCTSTIDNPCGCIDNAEVKKQCEDATYKEKMIEQCISRYAD